MTPSLGHASARVPSTQQRTAFEPTGGPTGPSEPARSSSDEHVIPLRPPASTTTWEEYSGAKIPQDFYIAFPFNLDQLCSPCMELQIKTYPHFIFISANISITLSSLPKLNRHVPHLPNVTLAKKLLDTDKSCLCWDYMSTPLLQDTLSFPSLEHQGYESGAQLRYHDRRACYPDFPGPELPGSSAATLPPPPRR